MNTTLLDRIALPLAVGALAVLGLRPASKRMVDPKLVVVQTPGATAGDAQGVADSLHAGAVGTLTSIDPTTLRGADLHLVGWGLDGAELRRVGASRVTLHPRPLPEGIHEVRWPDGIPLGDAMVVRITGSATRATNVVLSDPNGAVDSASVPRGDAITLELRHTPRAAGAALYTLRWGAAIDTFSILVSEPTPPTTLILASAPSREWSDLRDWLAGQGGAVTLRTRMTRDQVATDRMNRGVDPRLDRASLAKVGLVVTDGRTLAGLSSAERNALTTAIDEGLGMIVHLDETTRGTRAAGLRRLVPWRQEGAGEIDSRDLRPEADGVRFSATPVPAEPFTLAPGATTVPRLGDGRGGTIAASVRSGRGRITGTLVSGAGRWLRGGEPAAYAGYWSTLVRATARPDLTTPRWEVPGRPWRIDDQVPLARWGGGEPTVVVGGDSVTFAADPLLPGREVARWWPREAGWQASGNMRIWIAGPAAWTSWRAAERRRDSEAWIARQRGDRAMSEQRPEQRPWPLWPFFVLFVISMGWVWRRTED